MIPFLLKSVIFNFTVNTVPILSRLSGLSKTFIVKKLWKLSRLTENVHYFLWIRIPRISFILDVTAFANLAMLLWYSHKCEGGGVTLRRSLLYLNKVDLALVGGNLQKCPKGSKLSKKGKQGPKCRKVSKSVQRQRQRLWGPFVI